MPYADELKAKAARRAHYKANRASKIAYSSQWNRDNAERRKEIVRKRRYGLEPGQFQAIFDSQKGLCAICDEPFKEGGKYVHVDHCHNTNTVRGLLCARCNVALGNFGDSPQRLLRAVEYLKRSSEG